MGLITASIATAMTGGGVMVVPELICQEPRPAIEKLLSERMPLQGFAIHVTVQPVTITPQMSDVIHSAILRSFEHQYHI